MKAWIMRAGASVAGGLIATVAIAWLAALIWPMILSVPTRGWQRFVLADEIEVVQAGDRTGWVAPCLDFKARCSTGLCYINVRRNTIGARIEPGADPTPGAVRAAVMAQALRPSSDMPMLELDRGPGWLRRLSPEQGSMHRAIIAGWPWPALGGWEKGPVAETFAPTNSLFLWRPIASWPALPLRPIWPGMALNTALVALVIFVPFILHARRRAAQLADGAAPDRMT